MACMRLRFRTAAGEQQPVLRGAERPGVPQWLRVEEASRQAVRVPIATQRPASVMDAARAKAMWQGGCVEELALVRWVAMQLDVLSGFSTLCQKSSRAWPKA